MHKSDWNTISCSYPKLSKHTSVKYLGLIIDQNLKWNIHIENLINKFRQLTYFFRTAKKNKQKLPKNNILCNDPIFIIIRKYCSGWLQHCIKI